MKMTAQPLGFATLLQLYAFLVAIADPVRKLTSVYTKIQAAEAAANRIYEVFDRMPMVRANAGGPRLERLRQEIEFRNVCFSFDPARPVLANIDLTVTAGETIAIVGPNGCGKTTLLGLIPRFYDPNHGGVYYDGVNLRTAHLRSLRKQIAIVTQDTRLFDDTIFCNIAYGKKGATREEVVEAATKANIHDFIRGLPEGYETRVGDMGAPKLSGGQQQKISLARAILRDPSVLILDEFTSAADAESEAAIFQDIRDFVKGRTTFLITHRLHTLEIADRIVVMNEGQIEAVGTHPELIVTCELYRRLCSAQNLRSQPGRLEGPNRAKVKQKMDASPEESVPVSPVAEGNQTAHTSIEKAA
jgi:ATP-binding cassette subfamily B protein/subfamily B ATP-binding cassette protein MsbA